MHKPEAFTQCGCTIRAVLATAAGLVVLTALQLGWNLYLWLTLLALAILIVLFSSLTVTVAGTSVHWHFGPGFWKRRLPLEQIAGCTPVRNPWWYGWGIRYTPRGWLYNVSGLSAVEILKRDGRRLRLGTDRPEELSQAIRRASGL